MKRTLQALVLAVICGGGLHAQQTMSPEMKARIYAAARDVVQKTGVPSAQVGVVVDGRVAYTAAFGNARLSPAAAATVSMHYPIGSISKQFTAACVLLLVEDGKMKLDDPVAKWFPELTRSKDVTVRMLLSHTSGYSDYAPQDYTIPEWMKPADPLKLVQKWAERPLDFEPGTKWQYSNTNFVLAALIVEKVSGQAYWDFLKSRVLDPAGLKEALNLDTDRARVEPQGTERHALGPLRPATLEAPGWYFGDASLAMPVGDLLQWDIHMMNQKLLKPESWRAMETEVLLKNGAPTAYGLAVSVAVRNGRRVISHSGEVGGFVADNVVYPDDRTAIAVLTNQEASGAAAQIAAAVAEIVQHPVVSNGASPVEAQVRSMLDGIEQGKLDRAALTEDCSYYFSPQTLGDFTDSLKPLGPVTEVKQTREALRGGMTFRGFAVTFRSGKKVNVSTYWMPDGKIEQFLVEAAE